jgi:two-component system, chemotaxis family, sensor kinase CheA
MDDLLKEFLAESAENLARLDVEIVALEQRPDDPELLGSIFRAIHTIKGTCGFLDLARLERVSHATEDVLGMLRDGSLALTHEVISDVLAGVDVIKAILAEIERTGTEPDADDTALLERLGAWTAGAARAEVEPFSLFEGSAPVAELGEPGVVGAEQANPRFDTADIPTLPAGGAELRAPARGPAADASLRVGVGILDLLMNLAGELVLTRNQLLQLAQDDEESAFRLPLQHLNRVTSELQEAVMKTRLQPIGNAWGKLPRLVRDLSRSSGKQIDLEMIGAETELDRQILQAIGDPLTHMVRNSLDHGVETPAERRAAGKPERGTVTLEAFHEGGYIVVEIRDDGRGLDAGSIRRKAVERGLVRPENAASLSDAQLFRFIFEAGFSTAEKVTSVSGRGVGMDVVRSNIESIGGRIDLHSIPGRGTTIRIKIPLTLAILSALIVDVAGQSYAIPQIGVVELVRIGGDNATLLQCVGGTPVFRLRESLLPLVRLGEALRCSTTADQEQSIVVCQVGGERFGVVVDQVVDTQEIVVKPLGRMVKSIPYFSGTTILGDGSVIMILDIPALSVLVRSEETDAAGREPLPEAIATEAADAEHMSLIVFGSGGEARQAVPLALVSRLEKIPVGSIEYADGRWLVQYRGGLLPLVPASPAIQMRALPERPVIVFSDGERAMGLAVEEIHDITEDRLRIQSESGTPGLLGAAVIAGISTEVVDIHHFLRAADPRWFRRHIEALEPQKILLVEDSAFFRNVVVPALSAGGYEVVTADDGQEALDRLESGERFDVILSDIDMPRVDGWEFATRVNEHPLWRETPMLALTGRSSEADRRHAAAVGFRGFLPKFDRDAVLGAVRAAIHVREEAPV